MTLSTEMSDASGLAEETDIDVVGEGEDEDDEEEEDDEDEGGDGGPRLAVPTPRQRRRRSYAGEDELEDLEEEDDDDILLAPRAGGSPAPPGPVPPAGGGGAARRKRPWIQPPRSPAPSWPPLPPLPPRSPRRPPWCTRLISDRSFYSSYNLLRPGARQHFPALIPEMKRSSSGVSLGGNVPGSGGAQRLAPLCSVTQGRASDAQRPGGSRGG
ncbi:PREDICTED: forkhead box protein D1-like [Chrysochloris asiatica]|uniref:Forkhead box protein D1-like n=1 Tax=Chrysochloris asiatica TaxID=185453 RepID=A0A9B0U886_CHRAS|nr:PREDICTED: forkhead box protein D1-like [Chrysochloris asiatica]